MERLEASAAKQNRRSRSQVVRPCRTLASVKSRGTDYADTGALDNGGFRLYTESATAHANWNSVNKRSLQQSRRQRRVVLKHLGTEVYLDPEEIPVMPEAPPSLNVKGEERPSTRVASLSSVAIFPLRPDEADEAQLHLTPDPSVSPPKFKRHAKHVQMKADHLIVATRRSDITAIIGCLNDGVSVNAAENRTQLTALHEACRQGCITAVDLLLHPPYQADVHACDAEGWTPLHHAVASLQENHKDQICQKLIEADAIVCTSDKNGRSVLHVATACPNEECLETLLASASAENPAAVNLKDHCGRSPLHDAVEVANPTACEAFIQGGALVALEDEFGRTPLHLAASQGYKHLVALLIKANAPLDVVDCHESSPLLDAAAEGHSTVIKLLLQESADPNAVDEWGRTALHHLCKIDTAAMEAPVRMLVEAGAKIQANLSGKTPSQICMNSALKAALSKTQVYDS